MADFGVKTTETTGRDYRWLRSKPEHVDTISVSIQVSLLKAGTDYDQYGNVPCGLALGKIRGENQYGPFDPTATDGREVLAGFLFAPEKLENTFTTITTTVLNAAMAVEGTIDPAYVPNVSASLTDEVRRESTGTFRFYNVDPVEES